MIFKFLALKLNKGTPLIKNLKPEVLYKFSDDYRFIDRQGKITDQFNNYQQIQEIQDKQSFPVDLYKIDSVNHHMDITISAIVGRNGAGKSSLLEAFYQLIFCIAEGKKLIEHIKDLDKKINISNQPGIWRTLRHNAESIHKNTQMELYFRQDDDYFVVRQRSGITEMHKLEKGKWSVAEITSAPFFYSIVVNYSQYSLNASWEYYWLKPLFHKNDGYITPIVINPFRDAGNIDINRETHLAQIRLLTNLSYEEYLTEELIDDKKIDSVTFFLRPAKNGIIYGLGQDGQDDVTLSQAVGLHLPLESQTLLQLFTRLLSLFELEIESQPFYKSLYEQLSAYLTGETDQTPLLNYDEEKKYKLEPGYFRLQLAIYILTKCIKICNKYPDKYRSYTIESFYKVEKLSIPIRVIRSTSLANALFNDPSHVTLKLKQAINLLVSGYLADDDWEAFADEQSKGFVAYKTDRNFDSVRKAIRENFKNGAYRNKHLSNFVPSAFLTPAISISATTGKYLFDKMSSGEQQLIHSVHSVLYHMLNLNSIYEDFLKDDSENRSKPRRKMSPYRFVNLVLDEIELYYHPIYQRRFVQFLLKSISKVSLPHINGIQILFSTHSPFILSDIPKSNVLRLQAGEPAAFQEEQTFGANIHDMLADSFFLEGGHIGAFAEQRIEESISYINEIRQLKSLEALQNSPDGDNNGQIENIWKVIGKLPYRKNYQRYEDAYTNERHTQSLRGIIELIGEQVIRAKLLEMYDEAMPDDQIARNEARQQILELMRRNNLERDDI
jgi:predicted ATPase